MPARAGSPQDTLNVFFTQPINATFFDSSQVQLQYRASAADPWTIRSTAGLTLVPFAGNNLEYTLTGLAALTGTPGDYQLTFNGAAVHDQTGSPVAGSLSEGWHLDAPPVISPFSTAGISEGSRFLLTDSFTTPEQQADPFSGTVNWGDGGTDEALVITGQQFNLAHTFADAGGFDVHVTIHDVWGATTTMTEHVNVTNVPPTVVMPANATAGVNLPFSMNGLFSDPGIHETFAATVDYGTGSGAIPLALNADKTFTLNKTYTLPGTYTVIVRITDSSGSVGMATRQVVVSAANLNVTTRINDGSPQRSKVTSMTYTFNTAIDHFDSGAFDLKLGTVTANVAINVANPSNDKKTFVLTFSGAGTEYGSLIDGRYTMTLHADRVHDIFGQTLTGGDSVQNFYRLFGDADGNGYVSTDELALFRSVLNKKSTDAAYLAYFDFDGDGTITTADYAQFSKRLGKRI
jgi:hypothetical protein